LVSPFLINCINSADLPLNLNKNHSYSDHLKKGGLLNSPNSNNRTRKKLILSTSAAILSSCVGLLLFQNCGPGFEVLSPLDKANSLQLGSGTPPSGVDPAIATTGDVSYGLFNKIVLANGIVPGPSGKAVLVQAENKTYVYVTALGLQPNQMYHSHLHVDTCANGAGGHFKKDPSVTTAVETNEIWLMLNSNPQGVAYARTEVPYLAGQKSGSVVIHDLDGSKLYCADLVPQVALSAPLSQWAGGAFQPMTTTKPGVTIFGNATKVVLNNHLSGFKVSLWGLTPNAAYPIHVHAGTCATGGGGHFMIDAAAPAGSTNEAWLNLTASAKGSGVNEVWINQVNLTTPTGALSVVVHDPTDSSKQACADLVGVREAIKIGGLFQPTATGVDKQIVLSNAKLGAQSGASFQFAASQKGEPESQLTLALFGLGAPMYHAHVHTLPCSLGAGGHYKLDPSLAATVETNEVWAMLTPRIDLLGSATVAAPTYLRADAMSVVIHDPTDNSKMLCADLY
jgi:hypothetical protein